MFVITTKLVAVGLGLALTAFTISTIVLAIDKSQLEAEVQEMRERIDLLEEALRYTSTSAPTTITTGSTTATDTTATTADPEQIINYRLPDNVYPTHYALYLNPEIATGEFTGRVQITVITTANTNSISLHTNGLQINAVELITEGGNSIGIASQSIDTIREFLVIELSSTVATGTSLLLTINFGGTMQGKIVGLYSSSYTKADDTKKTIATSKFEPTYARQAYPCFDEPGMKATFQVTLVYPNDGGYHALSNMDIAEEVNLGEYTEAHFNTSVPMSTYLSCFIVSDFTSKQENINAGGIGEDFQMRVFATPEQIDKVDFALTVGKTVIEYYIDYFQIEYPLPKLDMAAIPDFVSGAMEHWGLVTYRETSLLYDETVSSTSNKQRIASVIAHEFAHMWFGNLVTMKWWNDLWLNEGFASYIEDKGVESVFPEWKMLDQFLIATLHTVLTLDATLAAHPIIQTVENPDQITEIFDTITYSKGASIIRMLEDFLGEETFRQGVTNYLNEFKYKNAVTDDFLTEIEKLGLAIDVKAIMRTWTEQMGLPVIEVEQVSNTQLKLTQKRFLSNPDDYSGTYDDSPFDYKWSIPITYKTSISTDIQRVWFYYDQTELIIELGTNVEWVKFNSDQVGYYRTNYPTTMWETLSQQLVNEPNVFTVSDRASLLNDAFALADSTQLSYDIALDITKYLSKEAEYVPWSVASSKLTSLKRTLMFTDTFVDYSNYARQLIAPIYQTVGWEVGTDHLENLLRVTVLNAACSLALPSCLQEVATRHETWLSYPDVRPHPDIRQTVYYYGMQQTGDEQTWEAVWALFIAEQDATEKSKLMYGLAAVQVPWILSRYIDLAWNEEYVRGQDYFTCLQYIAANPVGEPIVWDYVREHWQDLVDRFGLNERYLGSMIPSITARFSTQTKLEEMEYFFNKYPEAGAGTAARVRALETVKNNIVWLENNRQKVGTWLTTQQGAA